jgi:hypothetical protein
MQCSSPMGIWPWMCGAEAVAPLARTRVSSVHGSTPREEGEESSRILLRKAAFVSGERNLWQQQLANNLTFFRESIGVRAFHLPGLATAC